MAILGSEDVQAMTVLRATRSYIGRHRKPVALYSDKHSAFRNNTASANGDGMTHLGWALHELNIEILCAKSPQPAAFRPSAKPLSGRYLSLEERAEIAFLLVQSHGVREIARRLGRAASAISRGIRRNAATLSGNFNYRATTVQWHAERVARRPKVARLAAN